MGTAKIISGTIGYAVVTFPLAYWWQFIAFESTYKQLSYFSRDEPIVAFGFVAILLQGLILSVVYPHLCAGKGVLRGALTSQL